ncbi:hypothetical protein BKA93DRAFT_772977 [Sparassis latifolia]
MAAAAHRITEVRYSMQSVLTAVGRKSEPLSLLSRHFKSNVVWSSTTRSRVCKTPSEQCADAVSRARVQYPETRGSPLAATVSVCR